MRQGLVAVGGLFSNIIPLWALILACCGCKTIATEDAFVAVAAGEYVVGGRDHFLNPKRKVQLSAYEICIHELSNAEFEAFVAATGYVTVAEKHKDAMVFYPGLAEFRWHQDSTAFWRYPNGITRGGIAEKMDHPVTCISFLDAQAYCEWAGMRLPSLDEWEVAARAGSRSRYYWGNAAKPLSKHGNIWYGKDHLQPDTTDPYLYTAPIGSFAANPWGLFDVYGNLFELCADKPELLRDKDDIACSRGGSWWCSASSCNFFNSVDIGRVNVRASFSNQGFRVVRK
jgi:formylglycine-generating enzyme